MELDVALQWFLEHENYASETVRAYRGTLEPFVHAIGAKRPIDEITPAEVDRYVAMYIKAKDHWSPTTKYKHIKAIKALFNYLSRDIEVLEKSPARKVSQVRLPKRTKAKYMPDELYQQLIDHCWRKHLVFELALALALGDGKGRIGGLWTALVSDINWEKRAIWVEEKLDSDGWIIFGEFCELAIRQWLNYREFDSPYLFSSDYNGGSPFETANGLSLRFRRAGIAAGIGSWGPHSLRHRANVVMAAAGVNDELRARVLRHDVKINRSWYTPFPEETVRKTSADFTQKLPARLAKRPPARTQKDDKIIYLDEIG